MLAWAFAAVGQSAPLLFEALAVEAQRRAPTFNEMDVANTVSAFATAQHRAPELFEVLLLQVQERLTNFNRQDVRGIKWAFAAAEMAAPALLLGSFHGDRNVQSIGRDHDGSQESQIKHGHALKP